MKYEDPKMEAYWNSLPSEIQSVINQAGIEICSLGMLQKLGDYYKNGKQVASVEYSGGPVWGIFFILYEPLTAYRTNSRIIAAPTGRLPAFLTPLVRLSRLHPLQTASTILRVTGLPVEKHPYVDVHLEFQHRHRPHQPCAECSAEKNWSTHKQRKNLGTIRVRGFSAGKCSLI